MDIEEARKRKDELEISIKELINKFEADTKLCLDEIRLERGYSYSGGYRGILTDNFPVFVVIKVRI